MLIFEGSLNENILKIYNKKQSIFILLFLLPFIIISLILTILNGVYNLKYFTEYLFITLLLLLIALLIYFVPCRNIIQKLPKKIIIDYLNANISLFNQGLKEEYSKPRIKSLTKIKKY